MTHEGVTAAFIGDDFEGNMGRLETTLAATDEDAKAVARDQIPNDLSVSFPKTARCVHSALCAGGGRSVGWWPRAWMIEPVCPRVPASALGGADLPGRCLLRGPAVTRARAVPAPRGRGDAATLDAPRLSDRAGGRTTGPGADRSWSSPGTGRLGKAEAQHELGADREALRVCGRSGHLLHGNVGQHLPGPSASASPSSSRLLRGRAGARIQGEPALHRGNVVVPMVDREEGEFPGGDPP